MTPNESAAKHEWLDASSRDCCACGWRCTQDPFSIAQHWPNECLKQHAAHIASLAAQPLVPATEGPDGHGDAAFSSALRAAVWPPERAAASWLCKWEEGDNHDLIEGTRNLAAVISSAAASARLEEAEWWIGCGNAELRELRLSKLRALAAQPTPAPKEQQ
jgi:hypothetical protein